MASSFPLTIYGGSPIYPEVKHYNVDSAATFIAGALVIIGTGDDIEEAGADPTSVLGVALASAANKTLYHMNRIPVAILAPGQLWCISSSTTPAESHLGDEYGVVKSTFWKLDTAEVTATAFRVVDYSPKSGSAGQEWFIVRPQTAFCAMSAA